MIRGPIDDAVDWRTAGELIGLAVLAQALAVGLAFPISELLTDTPMLRVDAPFHWYQAWLAQRLAPFGLTSGFDPYFEAGYLGGVTQNLSGKIPAFAATIFQSADPGLFYKLYSFSSALLGPALVLWCCLLLGMGTLESLTGLALAFIFVWISTMRGYHVSGMVSYALAMYAAIAFSAWMLRAWQRATLSWRETISLGLLAGLGILYHALFAVAVAIVSLSLLAFFRSSIRARALLLTGLAIVVLSLLTNGWWMRLVLSSSDLLSGDVLPYMKLVDHRILYGEFVSFRHAGLFNWLLLGGALAGAVLARRDAGRRVCRALLLACAATLVLAAFGAWIPSIAALQPNRFTALSLLLLVPAAAIGWCEVVMRARSSRGFARVTYLGVAGTASLLGAYYLREAALEPVSSDRPHYWASPPEVRGEGPMTRWLLAELPGHLGENASRARILFEHSSVAGAYDTAHVAGYLAARLDTELMTTAYPMNHPTAFWDGRLFGREVGDWSREDLVTRLRLFNIGWVVTSSPAARAAMACLPQAHEVAARAPVAIFRIDEPPGLFLRGSGIVAARKVNWIALERLAGDRVVLRYHYLPGLRTLSGTRVTPHLEPGWDRPFVQLESPRPQEVLTYGKSD